MHPHVFPTITLSLMIVTITLIHCPTYLLAVNERYLICEAPFNCGDLMDLSYPFWGSKRPNYCGHPSFQLDCSNKIPRINITYMNYRVLKVFHSTRILKVAASARTDYFDFFCPAAFVNTSIDNNLFSYITSLDTNLTLYYNCRTPLADLPNLDFYQFNCSINRSTMFINYYTQSSQTFLAISNLTGPCNYWVNVPVLQSAVPTPATYDAITATIDSGFMLGWNASNSECDTCLKAGGLCGSDPTTSSFACHCTNGTSASGCSTVSTRLSSKLREIVIAGIAAALLGIIVVCIIICCLRREELSKALIFRREQLRYIAPEVFSRNFGGVSHKSDVYSYGMLVLEMVGGRKNFDNGVSNRSEIYFPDWIYKDLELGMGGTYGVMTAEEQETRRKMILVSLWCIQTNPSDRPSMNKVIEMLEGTLHSLKIPPKPFLLSPKGSPVDSSTTS
ncbi:hypothetical protein CMV_010785 [Castanea mollissima]|uniref:non-specific serine/threonine protein kinase n=1 Tax=Castanea mollissima TaxID=60419 RepID=A0A8J4RMF5_9ROSI|nr:hypothetical protein CMV_010785 [Castanea mollissima]